MIWPFKPGAKKKIAKIEVKGAIAGATRDAVLEALEVIEDKGYPALLLRVDSPGGTVGDSQEIYEALKRIQDKVKIVASFGRMRFMPCSCNPLLGVTTARGLNLL